MTFGKHRFQIKHNLVQFGLNNSANALLYICYW